MQKRIAVIGAGASGIMASYSASNEGAIVTLFDKNQKIGKKLFITGKGRCNVTNDVDVQEFMSEVVNGGKFLYSALNCFKPSDTMEFLESFNCPLKVERGGRVFPLSDKSSDIIRALELALRRQNVNIQLESNVLASDIQYKDNQFTVLGQHFDALIIACGGLSYPSTGSSGEGYSIAKKFGHTIKKPVPALVGIELNESVKQIEGLSLKNVALEGLYEGKRIYYNMGEMLFTANGISGPLVLSFSSLINRLNLKKVQVVLDLKPALSFETLDNRVLRDFTQFKGKIFKNCLGELLPKSLIPYIIEISGIDGQKSVDHITAVERKALLNALKQLRFSVKGLGAIEGAIVTSGGVELNEVTPNTMQSKLQKGLYFAGEMLDIDAFTGGYNIQIAFSTGYLAGKSATKGDTK